MGAGAVRTGRSGDSLGWGRAQVQATSPRVQSEYTFLLSSELTMPSSHSCPPVKGTKPAFHSSTLPSPHAAKSCQIPRSPELPQPSPLQFCPCQPSPGSCVSQTTAVAPPH